jgi:demethylmenaquinone methyltransferase / 2-methoxy-6-polyprenyl-1,4-benzoquinol methylase
MTVVPYKELEDSKKQQVGKMFDNISHKYDFLNHFLSAGIDIVWRKKAIKMLKGRANNQLLDIATGTGDFALEALALNPDNIIGVDISEGMLEVGREKIKKRGLEHIIQLKTGDSENLPFEDNKFDTIIVSFGVRNFENLQKGLSEMNRVLKPGGMVLVLEFSQPESFPFKQLYNFYFKNILPLIGKIISKDNSAYSYLYESVSVFPYGERFLKEMQNVGFNKTKCRKLTLGIASIYTATK